MPKFWSNLKLLLVGFFMVSLTLTNSAQAEDPLETKHRADPSFMSDLVKQGLNANVVTMPDLSYIKNVPLRGTGKLRVYNFTINQIKWELLSGVEVTQWAFNSQVPGPTVYADEGDTIRIITKNWSGIWLLSMTKTIPSNPLCFSSL